MENQKQPGHQTVILLIVLFVVVVAAYGFLHRPAKITEPETPAAPATPAADETASWQTFTDPGKGVSFKYPTGIGATYIHPTDWPPQIEIVDQPYKCTPAGSENAQAGKTDEETVSGYTYCVTRETEGAAGSTYTQYAYGADRSGQMAFLRFSLQFVQCGNYDEPEMTACQNERSTFDIGPTVDKMFQTITTTQ